MADLHMRVTDRAAGASAEYVEGYRAYFPEVFLKHPWMDESIGSLVHQEEDGRITGFLGMVPRRMTMRRGSAGRDHV